MATEPAALRKVERAHQRRAELKREADRVLRDAMLEARQEGHTLRAIGKAANMSHVAAYKIIHAETE